jgi:MFS family permease
MFNYTVILYLQDEVGSDLLSGIGFGLAFGSSAVFGWFGGLLCDRVAPARVIHGAQALFLLGLACLWWADAGADPGARVKWVLSGAFCGGLAWSFVGPARLTALGQIARPVELQPLTIAFNLQVLLGFGLAPLLIGLLRSNWTWPLVLAVAAAGFLLSSLLLSGLRTYAHPKLAPQSIWADIAEGFRAVGQVPLLRQLMLTAMIGYAMTGPLQILLPRLARLQLDLSEAQRGAYLGLLALCLIAGGFLALRLAPRLRHGRAILGGVLAGSFMFSSLALIHSPAGSALALSVVGLLGGMAISLVVAGIQVQAPAPLRGRVMSMYAITSQVVPAVSGVLAGGLLKQVGVTAAVVTAGLALALVAALATWRMTVLRDYVGQ